MKRTSKNLPLRKINALLSAAIAVGGAAALAALLRLPSETNEAVLLGYSALRLALAAGLLAAVGMFALVSGLTLRGNAAWLQRMQAAHNYFALNGRLFWLLAPLAAVGLAALVFLAAALSPLSQTLILLASLYQRMGLVVYWVALACLLLLALLRLNFSDANLRGLFNPFRLGSVFLVGLAALAVLIKIYTLQSGDYRFFGLPDYLIYPALAVLLWAGGYLLFNRYAVYRRWLAPLLGFAAWWALFYVFYLFTAHLVNWQNTPSKAYWNLLADAFLHGRLYLINPPTTHDLTLFQGNWYVPNPPLPALALMPLVALFGTEGVNMVVYSVAIAALNAALVYVILQEAAQRGLIPTSRSTNLGLTVLFAVGTDHWWLAILGQMWFVSQLLTLLCAALAVLLALRRKSPGWVGLFLGLAVLSRPNIFTLWPFLLGISLYYQQQEFGRFNLKAAVRWAIQSALPVVACVVVLLGYNVIRFGDWLDFGYVTINGADAIVAAVQTYGMFNAHFVASNLEIMLLRLPSLVNEAGCWIVERTGYSLLAMTPALVYLFRRLRKNWWTLGAWVSIVLSVGLLAFYHNNGSSQLGYRYLMDFILPVLLLMGVGVGQRSSWVFKLLVALSVAGNFIGILYWFRFSCPV